MLADEELPNDSDASRSPRAALPEVNLPPPGAGLLPHQALQAPTIGFRPHSGGPLTATVSIKAQPTSPHVEAARMPSPSRPGGKPADGKTQALAAPRCAPGGASAACKGGSSQHAHHCCLALRRQYTGLAACPLAWARKLRSCCMRHCNCAAAPVSCSWGRVRDVCGCRAR